MFPAVGEEKIDAVIFSNGFPSITAAGTYEQRNPMKDGIDL